MSDQYAQQFTMEPHGANECRTDIEEISGGNLLPRILRVLGAGIIFSCASVFLFQRWGVGNDIQRYLILLAFTAVLTAGGFFCGLKLKESKGARTLLALTLAVTPVNFAVLGALLYSQFSLGEVRPMPAFATWIAPTPESALMVAAAGALALAPLCFISFMAMGRYRARSLSVSFFLGNLALLVPTRQPDPVGVLTVLTVVGLTWCELRYFRNEATLKTWEGRFARLLMWAPPLLLVGRTGYFYYPSEMFSGCILAAAALLGFIFLPTLTRQLHAQKVLQGMSTIAGSVSWLLFADVISRALSLDSRWTLPLCTLPTAALLFFISFHAIGGGAVYRRSAALIALIGGTANLFFHPGLPASFMCLATSVLVLVYGFAVEQRIIFFSGLAGAVASLGYHLKFALSFYSLLNWGTLAITGVAIVILASVLERRQGRVKEKIQLFRKHFQSWSN